MLHGAKQEILVQVSLQKVGNCLPCIFNFVKHSVPGQVQFLYEQSFRNMCTCRIHKVTKTKIKATGTHRKCVSMHECK